MTVSDVFNIVGSTLGGAFQVEEVVAEGGFSVIYRAYHGAFRAPVALKCLKVPGSMSRSEQDVFLEKFRGEAELLFRLSSSMVEVVRPLHADAMVLKDGRFVPYLALEWLEGDPFDKVLKQRKESGEGPLSTQRAIRILTPVAKALHRAHNLPTPSGPVSIVHCDLKPANIFVAKIEGKQQVKVLDFGIAQVMRVAELGQEGESSMSAFTPHCAAPEQWEPRVYGMPGPWTDVFALALTLTEALTLKRPIRGDLREMAAICQNRTARPTPRALGANIPDALEEAVRRALAVDPVDRTQDIETFWTEVERSLGIKPTFDHSSAKQESLPPGMSMQPLPFEGEPTAADFEPIKLPPPPSAFPDAPDTESHDAMSIAKLSLPPALEMSLPASSPGMSVEAPDLVLPAPSSQLKPAPSLAFDREPAPSSSFGRDSVPSSAPKMSDPNASRFDIGIELPQSSAHVVARHPVKPVVTRPISEAPPPESLRDRVRPALVTLGAGGALIALDILLGIILGSPIQLGAFRILHLGGLIALFGVAFLIARLAGGGEE